MLPEMKNKSTFWKWSDERFQIERYMSRYSYSKNKYSWLAFNSKKPRIEYKIDTILYNIEFTHQNVQWFVAYNCIRSGI